MHCPTGRSAAAFARNRSHEALTRKPCVGVPVLHVARRIAVLPRTLRTPRARPHLSCDPERCSLS